MSGSRKALAGFWIVSGINHFLIPKTYEAIVPPQSPVPPKEAVQISGVAEIAVGVAVLDDRTVGAARWGILALLAAVYPANIYMAVKPEEIKGLDLEKVKPWMLWARLPLQFVAAYWAWRAARPGGKAA